jgi:hypothetical protein
MIYVNVTRLRFRKIIFAVFYDDYAGSSLTVRTRTPEDEEDQQLLISKCGEREYVPRVLQRERIRVKFY